MFLQNKGHVTMTVELLDTEEAQADDPLDVQVSTHLQNGLFKCLNEIISIIMNDTHFLILIDLAVKWLFAVFPLSACPATWSSL